MFWNGLFTSWWLKKDGEKPLFFGRYLSLVPLNRQEFTALVTSFAEQIDLALKRVDKVTPEALEKISVQMKAGNKCWVVFWKRGKLGGFS